MTSTDTWWRGMVISNTYVGQDVLLTHLSVDRLYLLERGQHEHGRLAHAGLGLGQDVHPQHGLARGQVTGAPPREVTREGCTIFYLGDTLVLDLRRMLEATVNDGPKHLVDN